MKILSVAMLSAAVVTGLAGAGVAYEIASSGGDGANASVIDTTPVDAATTVGVVEPKKRWAPCERPAVLEGRKCVTDVVRTVILPAPSTQVAGISGDDDADDAGLEDASRDDADDVFDDHGDDGDDGDDRADSDDDGDDGEDHADSDDDSEDHDESEDDSSDSDDD